MTKELKAFDSGNAMLKELESLRAWKAEIERQEPVAFAYYSDKYKKPMLEQTANARGYEGEWKIVPLFAAPVISPDVATRIAELEAEVARLKQVEIALTPLHHSTDADVAKLQEKLKVAREALNELARLGNGCNYGNSLGNTIAIKALATIGEE